MLKWRLITLLVTTSKHHLNKPRRYIFFQCNDKKKYFSTKILLMGRSHTYIYTCKGPDFLMLTYTCILTCSKFVTRILEEKRIGALQREKGT